MPKSLAQLKEEANAFRDWKVGGEEPAKPQAQPQAQTQPQPEQPAAPKQQSAPLSDSQRMEMARIAEEQEMDRLKAKEAAEKAKVDRIRGGNGAITRTENGVKITTYAPVPAPAPSQYTFDHISPDKVPDEEKRWGRKNGFDDPAAPEDPAMKTVRNIARRASGAVSRAFDIAATSLRVLEGDKLLSEVSAEHGLNLSFAAKRKYEAIYTITRVSEGMTGGDLSLIDSQSMLAKWGKENNIPANVLIKLQMTDTKLNRDEMEALMHGQPLASADSLKNLNVAQAAASQLPRPTEITRMASASETELASPAHAGSAAALKGVDSRAV